MNEDFAPAPGPLLHVILHHPEIPQNTGNIGRSCVAVGAKLWLVRPLGYELDSRHLKRAGLDYWEFLDWEVVDSLDDILPRFPEARVWCFTKHGQQAPWEVTFEPGDILLFGSESQGLPESIRQIHADRCLRFPMHEQVRSLNLASTVNTALYEAVRQFGGLMEM